MIKMPYLYFFFAVILYGQQAFAQPPTPINLADIVEESGILSACLLIKDPTGMKTVDEIAAKIFAGQGDRFANLSANLGRTNDTIWIGFKLKNTKASVTGDQKGPWMVDLSGFNIIQFDDIDLYYSGSMVNWKQIQAGTNRMNSKGAWYGMGSSIRLLSPEPGDTMKVLVRIKNSGTSFIMPRIYTNDYFDELVMILSVGRGIYFGIFLMILLFSIISYRKLKVKGHLFYIFWLITTMIYIVGYSKILHPYIFFDPAIVKKIYVSFMLVSITIFIVMARVILNINKHSNPWLYRLMSLHFMIGVFLNLLSMFMTLGVIVKLCFLMGNIASILAIAASIQRWREGVRHAPLFLIAICWSISGTVVHTLLFATEILPMNLLTANYLPISFSLEAIFFTLTLISSWRASQRERELWQRQFFILLESSPTPIIVIGKDEKVNYINSVFKKTLGFQAGSRLENIVQKWSDQSKKALFQALRIAERKGHSDGVYLHVPNDQGDDLYLTAQIASLTDHKKKYAGVIIMMQNITDLKNYQRELETREKKLHSVTRELIKAEEEERHRISVELHDGLGQNLTAAKIISNHLAAENPNLAEQGLDDIATALTEAITTTRTLSFSLRAFDSLESDLGDTLADLADYFSKKYLRQISYTGAGDPPAIPMEIKSLVYRCVSELVFNAVKHSLGEEISIAMLSRDNIICISVTDDGSGFDHRQALKNASGLGLKSIGDRISAMGGELGFQYQQETGMSVWINIFLDKHEVISNDIQAAYEN